MLPIRRFLPCLLAAVFLAACQTRFVEVAQRLPSTRRTLAPRRVATPKPLPSVTPAAPRLLQPSSSPSLAVVSPSPSPSPSSPATPSLPVRNVPPAIAVLPLALNAGEGTGLDEETENLLVVSSALVSPLPQLRLVAQDVAAAYTLRAINETGPQLRPAHRGDRHAAFRRLEQRRAGLIPQNTYSLKQSVPLERGATRDFWVITDFVEDRYVEAEVRAEVLKVSTHCYVMVDQVALRTAVGRRKMQEMAEEIGGTFDTVVYPTNTKLFGAEPRPGVDGDPRIFILISPAVGNYGRDTTLGYFSQRDAFARDSRAGSALARSNQAEILYVSSLVVAEGTPEDYMGTIAHEFQHMINFNQKVLVHKNRTAEALWVDEGMAMYAIEAAGYGLKSGGAVLASHVKGFQRKPWAYSLSDWDQNPEGIGYGAVYLLMVYMADRFGADIIQSIVTSSGLGTENLDKVLSSKGSSLNEVFHDWALANVLDSSIQNRDARYQYRSLKMRGANGKTELSGFLNQKLEMPAEVVGAGRPFSVQYYRLPNGVIDPRVEINGTSASNWRLFPRLVLPQE